MLTVSEMLNRISNIEYSFITEKLTDSDKIYRMGIIEGYKQCIGASVPNIREETREVLNHPQTESEVDKELANY